jgi:RNA polymerase sigma factor (sigma-70 family)
VASRGVQGSGERAALFTTTHWSAVLAAGQQKGPAAREALEELCRTYWYPLYLFVRRHGYGPCDAQDLTQEFFARLIAKQQLARAQPERGRFRSFLLVSLKHFLADAHDRAQALKRGGGRVIVSLEEEHAEGRYQREPKDEMSPERLFERRWAYTLLETVITMLGAEFRAAGKQVLFEGLKAFLIGEGEGATYSQAAGALGLSEAAAKMTVTRMRRRYRELLRAEVAKTVAEPGEVESELSHLFSVLE